MAKAMDSVSCSSCQELLKDLLTIPCGHSYCIVCFKGCLDLKDDKGIYRCPQCGQPFTQRPVLNRGTVLVENLKKTRPQRDPPPYNYAAPGNVDCDFCTGRKLKAVKSCLVCLVSFCETHLQPHNEVDQLKKHKLVQASKKLQEKICSHHEKPLEIYCRTDQQCICFLCAMDEHKGHDTVSAAAEKKKVLGEKHQKSQERIQEKEKEIQELRQAVDTLKHSAQAAVNDIERIFNELICSIERRQSELTELVRAQEKAEVSQAEGLLKQLEQEVSELKRRDVKLKQFSNTEDHIHFLQSFQSFCVSHETEALPIITVYPHITFEHVEKLVSDLKDQLQDVCEMEMDNISWEVTAVEMIQPPHPKTREDFLTYSCHLTLDPNTACQCLCLSEGNRKVSWSDKVQSYPDHPERFIYIIQVLCRERLSGACYWEVEWCGERVSVAVSYKGISRKGGGNKCLFGYNDQSWMFYCSTSSCGLYHNKNRTDIPVPRSSRVGVYLDHRAGTLSFYTISDTMTLLHRVQTTFTQPLYLGFTVYKGTSVKILTPIQ